MYLLVDLRDGILRHPMVLLIIGGVLTAVIGERIKSTYLQRRAKGAFSLRVVQRAYNRWFWSLVYVTRVDRQLSKEEITDAWSNLTESLEAWNTDLMGNICLFDRYYPKGGIRKGFESVILTGFFEIHEMLVTLRYKGDEMLVPTIRQKLLELNVGLKEFAEKLDVEFPN